MMPTSQCAQAKFGWCGLYELENGHAYSLIHYAAWETIRLRIPPTGNITVIYFQFTHLYFALHTSGKTPIQWCKLPWTPVYELDPSDPPWFCSDLLCIPEMPSIQLSEIIQNAWRAQGADYPLPDLISYRGTLVIWFDKIGLYISYGTNNFLCTFGISSEHFTRVSNLGSFTFMVEYFRKLEDVICDFLIPHCQYRHISHLHASQHILISIGWVELKSTCHHKPLKQQCMRWFRQKLTIATAG